MNDWEDEPYAYARHIKRWHNFAWAGLLRVGEALISAALCGGCLALASWFVGFSLERAIQAAGAAVALVLALAFGSNVIKGVSYARNAVGIIRKARQHGARW